MSHVFGLGQINCKQYFIFICEAINTVLNNHKTVLMNLKQVFIHRSAIGPCWSVVDRPSFDQSLKSSVPFDEIAESESDIFDPKSLQGIISWEQLAFFESVP